MTFRNLPIASISLMMIIYVIFISEYILVPLLIAIFLWYIISAIAQFYCKIFFNHYSLNVFLAVFSILMIIAIPIKLIMINIPIIIKGTSTYQENFQQILIHTLQYFHMEKTMLIHKSLKLFNLQTIIPEIIHSITNITSNIFLILLYVIFLFIEEKSFHSKFNRIFTNSENAHKALSAMNKISTKIQSYLMIKTATGFVTALLSFGCMKFVNLDFAIFWSLLIFLLNYIHNIGAVIAILCPILISILQYRNPTLILSLAIGLILIQFIIGNFIEPKAMGKSLNLSPIAIIFSLVLWGNLWGFTGMYLAVPITVIIMIITSEFESTRPISILLSKDGTI